MNERAIDKRTVAVGVNLELIEKVVKAYRKPGDEGNAKAFIRALECATGDVRLSPEELEKIERERIANYERRLQARKRLRG